MHSSDNFDAKGRSLYFSPLPPRSIFTRIWSTLWPFLCVPRPFHPLQILSQPQSLETLRVPAVEGVLLVLQ